MSRQWTEAQRKIIDTREKNILVSAAAGAGKTTVLVERIIELLRTEQIGLEQILMVTFTNAAAGEMRSRIYQRLQQVLETAEEPEKSELRRQLHLVGVASISTIHLFCMEVVRQYAFLLDISPDFRIGEVTEIQILREESLDEVLEKEYEAGSPDFLMLADLFSTPRSDSALREQLTRLYEFLQNQPNPEAWMREKTAEFGEAVSRERLIHLLQIKQMNQTRAILQEAERIYTQAIAVAARDSELAAKYVPLFSKERDMVRELWHLTQHQDMEVVGAACEGISFARLPSVPKALDLACKKQAQKLRDDAKKMLEKLQASGAADWIHTPQEMQDMFPAVEAMERIMRDFSRCYKEMKRERGVLDFNDLEHEALQLLRKPEVAQSYRQRFKEIFIDEYQDSNPVQDEILHCIVRENHLFMVGDIKQSIYRFRSADPGLFRSYYDQYKNPETSAQGIVVDMQQNFRSTQNIIRAVNDIFGSIMHRETMEIEYDAEAQLLSAPEQREGAPVEWLLLESAEPGTHLSKKDEENETEVDEVEAELEVLGQAELEALMLAQKIHALMNETVFDNGTERPMHYHDIVILLRSMVSYADVMAQVLTVQGIPVFSSLGQGYFDAVEVKMFLDLLRLLDNPLQDIPLLGVLRSPVGGFSIQELVEIRIPFRKCTYQQAMEQYISTYQDDLADRLRNFNEQCRIWRQEARQIPLSDFLWKLYQDTGYYEYVGAMPGGKQRQINLRLLLEKAQSFQQYAQQGLSRFLQYIEKTGRKDGKESNVAGLLSENDDVVRIMSVHKSKGLEFPVVILANIGKKFNFRDMSQKLLLHKELGIGIPYADYQQHLYRDMLPKKLIAQTMKNEQLAEEMRILYVACTRAKERLIFSGSIKNIVAQGEKWSQPMNDYTVLHVPNWMNWLGSILWHHAEGAVLHKECGIECPENLKPMASNWKLHIFHRADVAAGIQKKEIAQKEQSFAIMLQEQAKSAIPEVLQKKLEWKYPFANASLLPTKITVTQLQQMRASALPEEELVLAEPVFLQEMPTKEQAISGVYRGTLTHRFLQRMDFSTGGDAGLLRSQLQHMQLQGIFTAEEAEAIDLPMIRRLLRSPLGQRIRKARKIYREVPFNFLLPMQEAFPDYAEGTQETILLQGMIDLYFEEADGLVLLDYKTDWIENPQQAAEIVKERYALQVQLYRRALEKLTGKPVRMAGLYLLRYGIWVEIENFT